MIKLFEAEPSVWWLLWTSINSGRLNCEHSSKMNFQAFKQKFWQQWTNACRVYYEKVCQLKTVVQHLNRNEVGVVSKTERKVRNNRKEMKEGDTRRKGGRREKNQDYWLQLPGLKTIKCILSQRNHALWLRPQFSLLSASSLLWQSSFYPQFRSHHWTQKDKLYITTFIDGKHHIGISSIVYNHLKHI